MGADAGFPVIFDHLSLRVPAAEQALPSPIYATKGNARRSGVDVGRVDGHVIPMYEE